MTDWERLIKAHTEQTTLTTISAATERVAEEIAREMLADEVVRAELKALVRHYFGEAVATLRRNGGRARRGGGPRTARKAKR